MTETANRGAAGPGRRNDYFASTADVRAGWSHEAQDFAATLGATFDLRQRLREFRRVFPDMTQQRIAEITGDDQSDISRFERGLANPSLERANRILERLGAYAREATQVVAPAAADPRPLTTAAVAAKYFLTIRDEEDALSGLKLQKLLYYAQGFALALTGRALFGERIKAWEHGPVVPQIWHAYRTDKEEQAVVLERPADFDPLSLESTTRAVLERVYVEFGQFEAWKLREMTHQEEPWLKTERNQPISLDLLRSHFSRKIAPVR